MGNIYLLDCTLRDGGYINDWNFGKEAILSISNKIVQAGIDAFEIGFIKDKPYDENRTIFPSVEAIEQFIPIKTKSTLYMAMLDMSAPLPIEKLHKHTGHSVDALRVIFKKDKIEEAYSYCSKVIDLGYKLFVQFVSTDTYSDIELSKAIQQFNTLKPLAISIVDTFGLIKKKDFLRMVYIVDHNLADGIALGYHSHNNLQQAFSNAEAMSELNLKRDIYIDACVFGMGRGAGNLNLELFAEYLNENHGKHYRIEPILEIIDEYLNDIYQQQFWGYSLPFYLSATVGCHPNYAKFFAEKGTLSLKAFRELLTAIPHEKKYKYDKIDAEHIYQEFQMKYIDDRKTLSNLKQIMHQYPILLIAPGKSIETEESTINNFIEKNHPLVVSLNFIPEKFQTDFVFSSNMRRYNKIQNYPNVKKIITSNIQDATSYDYMVNFSSFVCKQADIIDNSGLMFINLLISLDIKDVWLAGFDGYNTNNNRHYVNSGLEYNWNFNQLIDRNQQIADYLRLLKKDIHLHFITQSVYNE